MEATIVWDKFEPALHVANEGAHAVMQRLPHVEPTLVLLAETAVQATKALRDAVWQGRDADHLPMELTALAVSTREAWQDATAVLLDMFNTEEA